MGKAIKKFIDRYILGEYHCDTCPYGWEDWYYEGDCDCGCYIFGDIRDSCRLIPPLRALIGWPRRKKSRYYASHQYDGFADFCEKDMQLQEKFDELFFDVLSGCKEKKFKSNRIVSPFAKDLTISDMITKNLPILLFPSH